MISVKMVFFADLWLRLSRPFRRNFASAKNKKMKTELSEELCADEAVCFIADRHHVTPRQLLRYFHYGKIPTGAAVPVEAAIPLESNEIEILKGLSGTAGD